MIIFAARGTNQPFQPPTWPKARQSISHRLCLCSPCSGLRSCPGCEWARLLTLPQTGRDTDLNVTMSSHIYIGRQPPKVLAVPSLRSPPDIHRQSQASSVAPAAIHLRPSWPRLPFGFRCGSSHELFSSFPCVCFLSSSCPHPHHH
jgi:hypothetical protein